MCRRQLILLAVISLLSVSAVCHAGEAKCWERTSWVPWTTLSGDGQSRVPVVFESENPVCAAFEKVLNSTCESPQELQWNWSLPLGETKFKKLKWEPLKWEDNWELTKDMGNSTSDNNKEHWWSLNKDRIRSEYENGKIRLSIATFDIDNDKQIEQVVRYDHVPPQAFPGTSFGVLNPDTKQIDTKYNPLNADPYICYSYEIMIYNGIAYRFGVDSALNQVIIFDLKNKSSTDICHIKYIAKKRRN